MVEKQQKFITDKRDIASKYGCQNDLNKKPLKNSKYDQVKSTVDTGKSIKKIQSTSDQLISKRKSELFKRVKGAAIVKLITDLKEIIQESIYNLGSDDQQVYFYNKAGKIKRKECC